MVINKGNWHLTLLRGNLVNKAEYNICALLIWFEKPGIVFFCFNFVCAKIRNFMFHINFRWNTLMFIAGASKDEESLRSMKAWHPRFWSGSIIKCMCVHCNICYSVRPIFPTHTVIRCDDPLLLMGSKIESHIKKDAVFESRFKFWN